MSAEKPRTEKHPLTGFFLRRYFRLAPMYYLAFLCTPFVFPGAIQTASRTVMQVFFLHGISPIAVNTGVLGSWSLANEAMFYAILPLLFRWIRSLRGALAWLVICVPASVTLSYKLAHLHPVLREYFTFFWFPVEMPVFLIGIAAFFLWKEKLRHVTDVNRTRALSLLLLLPLVAVPLMRHLMNKNLLPVSLALGCLCGAVVLHPWAILVNRATILLGKVSYSVYLIHFFFLYWILPNIVRALHLSLPASIPHFIILPIHLLVVLGASTAVAVLTWKFVEQPGIRLGSRINTMVQQRPSVAEPDVPIHALIERSDSPEAQF